MSIIEKILSKWNFKKIAVGYIVAALILIIGCVAAVGIIFGDRISFICQYHKLSESVQKNDFSNIKNQMDSISSSSNTIIDVLMLDKNNNVVYSSNNSVFGKENFTLYKADNKMSYFTCGKSSDTVLKYLENKSFMAASIFDKEEYDDFYEKSVLNKKIYTLSFIGTNDNSKKIYVIANFTPVRYSHITLKISACILLFLFMIYWVLMALWTYHNAFKSKLQPSFWGIIVLFTNIIGIIAYLFYKSENLTCTNCGASQNKTHIYCSYCGQKLGNICKICGSRINFNDKYCNNCGEKIKDISEEKNDI